MTAREQFGESSPTRLQREILTVAVVAGCLAVGSAGAELLLEPHVAPNVGGKSLPPSHPLTGTPAAQLLLPFLWLSYAAFVGAVRRLVLGQAVPLAAVQTITLRCTWVLFPALVAGSFVSWLAVGPGARAGINLFVLLLALGLEMAVWLHRTRAFSAVPLSRRLLAYLVALLAVCATATGPILVRTA